MIHHEQIAFTFELERSFDILKLIKVINYISRLKDKHQMVISKDAEKAFDETQYDKSPRERKTEETM